MSKSFGLRSGIVGIAFAMVVALIISLALGALPMTTSHAQIPLFYRAGSSPMAIGQAGIFITFSVPMPNTNYSVIVQQRDTAGYSTTSACTYFNPLHKTINGFDVQHKRCDDGVPVALDVSAQIDWVVIAYA